MSFLTDYHASNSSAQLRTDLSSEALCDADLLLGAYKWLAARCAFAAAEKLQQDVLAGASVEEAWNQSKSESPYIFFQVYSWMLCI